jgi:hypothetical protein
MLSDDETEDYHDLIRTVKKEEKRDTQQEDLEEWMDELLENSQVNYDYLEGKTIVEFQSEIERLLFRVNPEYVEKYKEPLKDFRYVDNICDLRHGCFVRWLSRTKKKKIARGGKFIGIRFSANHTLLMVVIQMGRSRRIISYSMGNFYTFQRLTTEESMILMANNLEYSTK